MFSKNNPSFLEKIFFLPFVLLIRLVSPIFYLRVSPLKVARIGHLIGEVEIYLCNKKPSDQSLITIDFFYIRKNEKICNQFLFSKVKKKIRIIPSYLGKIIYSINTSLNKFFNTKKKFFYDLNLHYSSKFLKMNNQQIYLTEKEIETGKKMAQKFNLMPDDKYICLICRDSAYMKNKFPEVNYEYHSFRNNDIDDFILASDYITERGYKVVRIGNVVEKAFKSKNLKIIDYSSSEYVSDFLDIYLPSQCEFIITTATGIDEVAAVNRKTFVTAHYAPLGHLEYRANKNFLIFKKYFCKNKKRNLTVSEIFDTKGAFYEKNEYFVDNQIELIKNTPEEILDVAKDALNYLENKKVNYDKKIQKKFWDIYYSKRRKYNKSYYDEDINCIINDNYLKKNINLIV